MADPTTNLNNNNKKVVSTTSNNYIPIDVVSSILSKLPLKSLKRFSCVSKPWSNLIEDPNFLITKSVPLYDDHDTRFLVTRTENYPSVTFSLGFGEQQEETELELDLPSLFLDYANSQIEILGSAINGIVCLYNLHDQTDIVLFNPYNREIFEVPFVPIKNELSDNTAGFTLHGFGYDPVNDDFKIILYVNSYFFEDELENSFWEIYSLRRRSWKRMFIDIPFHNDSPVDNAVYLDGWCHWLGTKDGETSCVVSYKLNNRVTSTKLDERVSSGFKLVVLNGFVAIIKMDLSTESFNVSILGELGVMESRITLFRVKLNHLSVELNPMSAGKKGKIFFQTEDGKPACIDLATGLFQRLIAYEGNIKQIVFYKESRRRFAEINN